MLNDFLDIFGLNVGVIKPKVVVVVNKLMVLKTAGSVRVSEIRA